MAMKIETGVPKNAAAASDELFKLQAYKSTLAKEVATVEAREKEIKKWAIDNLPKDDATGVMGKFGTMEIVTKTVPTVSDWVLLYGYIAKKKAWDMLQKKLSPSAITDRWGTKMDKVPGVTPFVVVSVKLTKKK